MKLFGYSISKDVPEKNRDALPEPKEVDGAIELGPYGFAGFYGFSTDFGYDTPEDEVRLITKYRELSNQPEFEHAIDDIVNEAFAYDEQTLPVRLNLDKLNVNDNIKKRLNEEFKNVLRMLNFDQDSYEIFKRWYVDGRLYYQKIIDKNNPSAGIQELRYIDPRKIKKVRRKINQNRANPQARVSTGGIDINLQYEEFYIYNPKGVNTTNPVGINISKDMITFIHSGLFSKENKTILSYLHKAIRFYNMLRELEDATVIYTLTRAPERRVFNVEIGDLPRQQAESKVKDMMNRFRKKMTYDPQTGEVFENKRFMSMMEDFWFPKRDGKGTTVDQLQSSGNLLNNDNLEYFQKKLYEALNVPFSRLESDATFNLGRPSEITRDELKFSKFVNRLRKRFSGLFDDILKTQLVLKGVIKEKDWELISQGMFYDFIEDNAFTELKQSDLFLNRLQILTQADPFVGKFYSKEWVWRNIMKFNDEEIQQEKELMLNEEDEMREQQQNMGLDPDLVLKTAADMGMTPPPEMQDTGKEMKSQT